MSKEKNTDIYTFNDNMKVNLSKKIIEKYLKNNKKNFKDINITQIHADAINKIYNNSILMPNIDLKSHFDTFIVLTIMNRLDLPEKYFAKGFHNWTSNKDWVNLSDPEYLYLIYMKYPDIVDFNKFFREYESPYDTLKTALTIPIIKNDNMLRIEIISFFESYNIKKIFNENTEEVSKRYHELWEQKKQCSNIFLLNPFEYMNYLKYKPNTDNIWSCKDISNRKELIPGESVICTEEEFWKRYDEFSCGILNNLPLDGCYVAGGSINLLLSKNFVDEKASDVDIFIPKSRKNNKDNKDNKDELFDNIVGKLNTDHTYYAIRGSVVNVYICGINRTIQLISIDDQNLYMAIRRFDLTHIQLAVKYGENNSRMLLATPQALQALQEQTTRFGWIGNLKLVRLVKALYRGYNIYQDERVLEKYGQLHNFFAKDNTNIQKIIREFHGYFHPKIDDDSNYILGMIEKHTDASLVTKELAIVRTNIIIGGKFKTDYEAMSFKNFNSELIVNTKMPRRYGITPIKKETGFYRLMSGKMIVSKINIGDNDLEVNAKLDDQDFIEFINKLETKVYPLYQQDELTRKIIIEKDGYKYIKFVMPNFIINSQEQRKYLCLRSQRGDPLNIKEDLNENDEIKVVFYMLIRSEHNNKSIELKPTRFIKFINYENNKDKQNVDDNIDYDIDDDDIEKMKNTIGDSSIKAYQYSHEEQKY